MNKTVKPKFPKYALPPEAKAKNISLGMLDEYLLSHKRRPAFKKAGRGPAVASVVGAIVKNEMMSAYRPTRLNLPGAGKKPLKAKSAKKDSGPKQKDSLKRQKEKIFYKLNHSGVCTRFYTVETEGKASFLKNLFKVKDKNIVLLSDLAQYKEIKINGGVRRIGYLIRIQAEITKLTGSVDLNGICAVGFAAKTNKITGSLKVLVHGLAGMDIPHLLPSDNTLTEDSLLKAIGSAAVIKSKVKDPGVVISPVELPADFIL